MKKVKIILFIILSIFLISFNKTYINAEDLDPVIETDEKYEKFKVICSEVFTIYNTNRIELTDINNNGYILYYSCGKVIDDDTLYGLLYIQNNNDNVYFNISSDTYNDSYNGGYYGWISGYITESNTTFNIVKGNSIVSSNSLVLTDININGLCEEDITPLPAITFAKGTNSINEYNMKRNIISVLLFITLLLIVLLPPCIIRSINKNKAKVVYENIIDSTVDEETEENNINDNIKENKENLKNNYYSRYREEDDDNE